MTDRQFVVAGYAALPASIRLAGRRSFFERLRGAADLDGFEIPFVRAWAPRTQAGCATAGSAGAAAPTACPATPGRTPPTGWSPTSPGRGTGSVSSR